MGESSLVGIEPKTFRLWMAVRRSPACAAPSTKDGGQLAPCRAGVRERAGTRAEQAAAWAVFVYNACRLAPMREAPTCMHARCTQRAGTVTCMCGLRRDAHGVLWHQAMRLGEAHALHAFRAGICMAHEWRCSDRKSEACTFVGCPGHTICATVVCLDAWPRAGREGEHMRATGPEETRHGSTSPGGGARTPPPTDPLLLRTCCDGDSMLVHRHALACLCAMFVRRAQTVTC